MQRTAQCRWPWRAKYFSARTTEMHCPCFTSSLHTLDPRREPAPHQESLSCSTTGTSQCTDELRQINCWKLWKYKRLSVGEICFALQMRQDATISNIINFERTVDRVDWSRLSKLVGLTASTTRAIFRAKMRANTEFCLSSDANNVFSSDIQISCSQSVTRLQINLVDAMLERGLKTSEILRLASLTVENGPTNDVEEPTNNVEGKILTQNTVFESLSSEMSEEGKENVNSRSAYDREGAEVQEREALGDSLVLVNNIPRTKLSTIFDLIQWLQKNQMVVGALTGCEAKHMLLLLLDVLEGASIPEDAPIVRNASESMACRVEMPDRLSLQSHHALLRMHRALCLKVVLLGVHIHVPRRSVEFVFRSGKQACQTSVYHVYISRSPSCTCPDFVCRVEAGYFYIPCKHLFYIYMVQLSIDKDLEHLMFQADLMEEDLERILVGHY